MKKTRLICLLIAIMLLISGCGLFESEGGRYEEDSIKAAESYVTSAYRREIGLAADSLESEIVYSGEGQNESEVYLIAVKCYAGNNAAAAYGVHCINGVKCGATKMLPPGYDFDENLEDLKALFGIVD